MLKRNPRIDPVETGGFYQEIGFDVVCLQNMRLKGSSQLSQSIE
jgi:hypothetical protein